jgi:hypothetical protein
MVMKNWLLGLIIVGMLSACNTKTYQTTRYIKHDFQQYKTYGWLSPVDSLSKAYFSNDIARHNILETANELLSKKGMSYTKEDPDVLFRYIAIVNNKQREMYNNYFMPGYGYYPYRTPYMYSYGLGQIPVGKQRYRAGHLILEAIDRKTNTVIWQARATQELQSPEKAINRLPKMVEQLLKLYPVK